MRKQVWKKGICIVMAMIMVSSITGCGEKEKSRGTSPEAKIITYGGIQIDENIKQAVLTFNKVNDEYQVEIRDYSMEEEPLVKMTADIIAGNAPDIIDLGWEPADLYIEKGILEDLTPYFEKDPEIHKEDVVPAVWKAMETGGKHYYIASGFYLNSLIVKSKNVGTGNGWTIEELKEILNRKGKKIQILTAKNKIDLLNSLLSANVEDFIDWDMGKSNFDSQDFKNLLEICNEYGKEQTIDDTFSEIKEFAQDRQLLLKSDDSINLDTFLMYDEIFGKDICYIGYPNKDKRGNCFSFLNRIAMYAQSDVKDGAWEFIRTFMTKEYQGRPRYMNYGELPTRQDCLDLQMEAAMATREYTNEMEMDITPRSGENEYDGIAYELKPMTQEQETAFCELLNNTTRCEQNDEALLSIIDEEVKSYFAGEKDLDETVSVIQNRVRIFVNEKR